MDPHTKSRVPVPLSHVCSIFTIRMSAPGRQKINTIYNNGVPTLILSSDLYWKMVPIEYLLLGEFLQNQCGKKLSLQNVQK